MKEKSEEEKIKGIHLVSKQLIVKRKRQNLLERRKKKERAD